MPKTTLPTTRACHRQTAQRWPRCPGSEGSRCPQDADSVTCPRAQNGPRLCVLGSLPLPFGGLCDLSAPTSLPPPTHSTAPQHLQPAWVPPSVPPAPTLALTRPRSRGTAVRRFLYPTVCPAPVWPQPFSAHPLFLPCRHRNHTRRKGTATSRSLTHSSQVQGA